MSHTGDEYENPVSGERGVVRLGSDDTDGRSVLVDLYLRPGGGPNEHVHSYLHETFEVLGGRVGFRLNGREEITGPGRRLEAPPQATPTRGARPSRCCGWRCSPRSSSGRSSWSRRHAGCSGCCSRCLRRSAVRVATRRPIPATWS
jgi:quercetin dioxygenase-like cupin family protein